MKSLLLPLCFAFLISGKIAAQTRCSLVARVTDLQTGEMLSGVSIKIDGEKTTLSTDSLGKIHLPLTCGAHHLRFLQLGYKPVSERVEIVGETLVEIKMENIATQMEEVVVSSQSAVRTMETPALGVNLLSLKAIEKLVPAAGEVDILRSLQTLPGISAVGEGANGINIRGGAVDQNLILLDNMPIFNPTHMLGLFSVFPTDAIREMQIYKGSIPAKYGGRTAGVLDVKMSDPSLDNFKMRGGIGLISNRLHVETPIVKGKLALMTSARFSFNEYLINFYNKVLLGNFFFEKRVPNNKPKFFDFANKIIWHPTVNDHVSLTNYTSFDSYRLDNLFSVGDIVAPQATMKYGHNNLALRWNHYFSERFNLNAQIVSSRFGSETTASEVATAFDFHTKLNYLNGKIEATFAPSTRQRINFGLTGTRYDIRPADLVPGAGSSLSTVHLQKEQAWETAVFASDEYELSGNLLAEIGFRYVNYWNVGPLSVPIFAADAPRSESSITDTLFIGKNGVESRFGRFEPRLALRYKIGKYSSVKIGYNRMNQFLQTISNNTTPLPDVRWKMSNRYVPPSQSDLVSVGYFRDTRSRMWEWSVEGYYRWQRHIFDYLNGAELSINPNVETQLLNGTAKAFGAELLVNKKKGVMTGWLSYTFARSFEKINGDFPALQRLNGGEWFRTNIDKPHTFNVLMSFQSDRHNAVSLTFVYSTGRPYTAPVSFYLNGLNVIPVYTDRNNARISDYHRLDFSWTITNPSMKKRRGEGSWVIGIYNLYGRKNAFSYFFNPKSAFYKPFKVSVFPSPIFSLTFNLKFEK